MGGGGRRGRDGMRGGLGGGDDWGGDENNDNDEIRNEWQHIIT